MLSWKLWALSKVLSEWDRTAGQAGSKWHPAENHFRFSVRKLSVYQHMVGSLKVLDYEMTGRKVNIHFGWPLSSWLDRFSIGVMVFNLMRLPRQFPLFKFEISYPGQPYKGKK